MKTLASCIEELIGKRPNYEMMEGMAEHLPGLQRLGKLRVLTGDDPIGETRAALLILAARRGWVRQPLEAANAGVGFVVDGSYFGPPPKKEPEPQPQPEPAFSPTPAATISIGPKGVAVSSDTTQRIRWHIEQITQLLDELEVY